VKLHTALQQKQGVAISAVAGMGGVGKTELALQYLQRHEKEYVGGICWLTARETEVAAQIINFAQIYMKLEVQQQDFRGRQLSLKEQVEWCWQHWQPPEGAVLVVLDDVTDVEEWKQCRAFLPKTNRFRVIITTRLQNLDTNFEQLPLDVLSLDEALELLTALVGENRVQREPETAENLCRWLGYLPLGLELVGRYLAEDPDLSLAEMLARLQAQRLQDEALDLDQAELETTEMTAKRGVRAAFELSWQQLDAMTQQVAGLVSLFAPEPFLWDWVESMGEWLNWEPSQINTGKKQLYKRYLIQRIETLEKGYKVHPLIREFLQDKLTALESANFFKQAFASVVAKFAQQIDVTPTLEQVAAVQIYIPHLIEVAQNLTAALSEEDLIWPFVGLGRFYEGQGLYRLAEPWREQCVSVAQDRLGENHLSVAASYNNLAFLYDSQGRYSEAEPFYLQALQLRKRLLGEEHPHVAQSYNNLAALYDSQGRYSEAEPFYLQALQLCKRLLGEEHPHVATSYNNLAFLYDSQGRYSEAEPFYLQALQLYKRLLGEEHPHVATSYNNLAELYRSQGRYSEAEPFYLQALQLRKRLLGEEHPHVAQSYNNLAALYDSQGRYSEAEPFYLQALQLCKRLLGEEHPHVATSYNNLAALYYLQERYSEAEPLYLLSLQLYKRLLGEEHPDVAQSYNNLAALYYLQERYSEAEPLYLLSLQLYKRLLGEEHPDVAQSYNNLALLYDSQGRYSEAEPLYKQALQLRKRLLGEEHPDVAQSYNNLAGLYYSQERYSEAEPLLLQALEISERVLGINHPNTVIFRQNYDYLKTQMSS
jgi:tetratricopeptide (TPR) repeat protein